MTMGDLMDMQYDLDDGDMYDEIDMDEPVEGVCFHILTEFNLNNGVVKNRFRRKSADSTVRFEPKATHPEAMHVADVFADEIQKLFRGSTIKRISPDMQDDEFHLYIVDRFHIPIAKIGIIGEDYRDRTIH
jgi:hypothetical protein